MHSGTVDDWTTDDAPCKKAIYLYLCATVCTSIMGQLMRDEKEAWKSKKKKKNRPSPENSAFFLSEQQCSSSSSSSETSRRHLTPPPHHFSSSLHFYGDSLRSSRPEAKFLSAFEWSKLRGWNLRWCQDFMYDSLALVSWQWPPRLRLLFPLDRVKQLH